MTTIRAEDPQPGGARRGTVTSVQVLTVPGRPERGDEVFVRHTCRGADWFDQVNHFAALPVSRVVRLRCGCCWRVEATRCDGTAVHVLVDREGSMAVDHWFSFAAVGAVRDDHLIHNVTLTAWTNAPRQPRRGDDAVRLRSASSGREVLVENPADPLAARRRPHEPGPGLPPGSGPFVTAGAS